MPLRGSSMIYHQFSACLSETVITYRMISAKTLLPRTTWKFCFQIASPCWKMKFPALHNPRKIKMIQMPVLQASLYNTWPKINVQLKFSKCWITRAALRIKMSTEMKLFSFSEKYILPIQKKKNCWMDYSSAFFSYLKWYGGVFFFPVCLSSPESDFWEPVRIKSWFFK